jgi:hypothetical protein
MCVCVCFLCPRPPPLLTHTTHTSPAIHAAELAHLLDDAFNAVYKHEEWQWKLSDLQKGKDSK